MTSKKVSRTPLPLRPLVVSLALLGATTLSWAGRPLSTNDANTADKGTCQIEAWIDRGRDDRTSTFAPACGVVDGLEVGLEASRSSPGSVSGAGWALKWAPKAAQWETAGGTWKLGLKFGTSASKAGGSWANDGQALLGLLSFEPSESVGLHLNVGSLKDRASGVSATTTAFAVNWSPAEPVLLFAETRRSQRRDIFGGAVTAVGARWWLIPEVLGLDVTTSRQTGVGGTTVGLGLGWYGLGR